MARRIDEELIRQILSQEDSDNEYSSGSEREDHLEADPAYETDEEDEVSNMNQQQIPGQDVQISGNSSPLQSVEGSIPSSSVLSSDLILQPPRTILRGKDKHKWSSQKSRSKSRIASRNIVHVRPGPIRSCKNELDPLQCFSFFMTNDMIDIIVTHTNAEIEMKSQKYKNIKATQRPTDADEIRALIGVLTLSAAMKDNNLPSRELFDVTFCGNRYRSTMSCDRFEFLINCLRFDDKSTRLVRKLADVFAPFRDLWNLFITKCRENYKPGSYLTIDEQLLGFRGRCPFRIYIPNKPNKYGIKIVMTVDNSTKYMIDAEPYLGSFTKTDGVPLGEYFVKKLTRTVHGTNRNITMDNWFTSVPLAKSLVKEPYKLTLVGTLRANKREIPVELQNERTRKTGTAMFCYDKELTLLSYKPKPQKVIFLLSSCDEEGAINDNTKKPTIVEFYNQTKGGVDTFDQMCSLASCSRKTRRWPLCMFYGMLNIAFINSYVIYVTNNVEANKKPLSRRDYLKALHHKLIESHIQKRLTIPTLQTGLRDSIRQILIIPGSSTSNAILETEENNAPNVPPIQKKRKICALCPSAKRRMTKTSCTKCNKSLCGEHKLDVCHKCFSL
ncbi:piggyBac transposable element-derived protein 4-like [Amyelois transitella]|uniref:piggyBac transposable element-derived protein 4-like n=1 Tax=Amyelois transitella TaxID=680683 RepID=UPI0029904003|nr:piggyBac transposable element-derived protein 4-like [Amyelois transitella]